MKIAVSRAWSENRKNAVGAESVEDFLSRYMKPERFTGRGQDYVDHIIKSYTDELEKYGFCFITHHSSVTGKEIAFYETYKR